MTEKKKKKTVARYLNYHRWSFFWFCFHSIPGIKQIRKTICNDLNTALTEGKRLFGIFSLYQSVLPHANQWKQLLLNQSKKHIQILVSFTD